MLLDLLRQGRLSAHEESLIYAANARRLIETRDVWPARYSWLIRVHPSPWFQLSDPDRWMEILLANRSVPASHSFPGGAHWVSVESDWAFEMGLLDPGSEQVGVILELFEFGPSMNKRLVWSGQVEVPVSVRPRLDDVVVPISSAVLDEFMTRTLSISVDVDRGIAQLQLKRVIPEYLCTFALKIEVLFDGEPVSVGHAWFREGWWGDSGFVTTIELHQIRPRAQWDPEDERLTVRVTGDGQRALGDFRSSAYWDGSIEMPVVVLATGRQTK
jgi:hypothetical protein